MPCLTLLTVKPVNAQTVPKPSIPEFTVQYVDRSYDVPITTTTTTDPFTGKQVTTTNGGQHVTKRTIDITIKNQPYSSVYQDDHLIQLYYVVRTKGHYADWTPEANNGYSFTRVLASSSGDTIVTLVIGSNNDIIMGDADVIIHDNGEEDFQVGAEAGYLYDYYGGHIMPIGIDFASFAESGWSNIKTLNMTDGSIVITPFTNTTVSPSPTVTPTLTETPTPSVPELSYLVIAPLLVSALAVAVAFRRWGFKA
jgi:hypothetical protein